MTRRAQLLAAGFLVIGFGVLGVVPLLPPSAVSSDAGGTVFSAERAVRHIPVIAAQPHPMGTDANAEVRAYLIDELSALGLEPRAQNFQAPDYLEIADTETVEVVNILARITGGSSTGAILLMAHYDSVPTTYGANDNAAAVSAILESARALLAGPPLRNDVILLFTDGEEPAPRFGAAAFVDDHAWASDVAFVINFEAIGRTGASMLIETAGPQSWVVGNVLASSSRPAATSFLTTLNDLIGGADTDFALFRDLGIPGLNFAYLHGSSVYHTLEDSPEHVDLDSVQHHGSHAVSIVRLLGDADFAVMHKGSAVSFFNFGRWLVHYPEAAALPLALLAALLLVVAAVMAARAGDVSFVAMGLGSLKAMVLVVTAGAFIALGWTAIVAVQSSPGVTESYVYVLILAGPVLTGLTWINRRWTSNVTHRERLGGIVVLLALLSLASAVAAPGASYVFTAPAIAGAIVLGWLASARWAGSKILAMLLAAAATMVLALPVCDLLLQVSMPRPGNPDSELVPAIALPGMIAGVLTLLLVEIALGAISNKRRSAARS